MFVTDSEIDLTELHSYVNEKLAEATRSSIGLALSTSLTSTENPNWLAEFFKREETSDEQHKATDQEKDSGGAVINR
jgi:hypothetical protein